MSAAAPSVAPAASGSVAPLPAGSVAPAAPAGAPLRLDVITIFPDYLRALDLSLIGRAAGEGLIDLRVHDLRDWARDRHRTVDDTPLGGGAGMVMKPDVWGEALDEVLALPADAAAARESAAGRGRRVLVVPTPAGRVFTQRTAEDLARADHLVFACGRYEGIDARVAEHYRAAGIEVAELSIGDYVLSGGEAAALVMIEAIARLRPGVLGNPDSVVEESHGASGLLEQEVYTRPVAWRGLDVSRAWPALLSGDHARVARQRRDRAIARTIARRPDMIERLRPDTLDAADRAALARGGWAVPDGAAGPVELVVRPAAEADLADLVDLAARTFPDACPPFLTAEQIARHVAAHLTSGRFAHWLADPRAVVTVAALGRDATTRAGRVGASELIGYSAVLVERNDDDGAPPVGLDPRPDGVTVPPAPDGGAGLAAELSKVYVDARLRGSGAAAALLAGAVRDAAARGVTALWLGTDGANRRAQRAYRRAGFVGAGSRTYDVGGRTCRDIVMVLNPQEAAGEY